MSYGYSEDALVETATRQVLKELGAAEIKQVKKVAVGALQKLEETTTI